jgi:hypothetical protein
MGDEMWILLFVTTVLLVLFCVFQGRLRPSAAKTRIVGNGAFGVEIKTAGKHLKNLKKICGHRTADCINRKIQAYLTFENSNYKNDAVRVTIEGHAVGYLPTISAVELRRALMGAGLGKTTVLECAAHIRGTWDIGRREQDNYGVWLDLPVDETS